MKNYFKFISKLFQIILILTIPNFFGYGQTCPGKINNKHDQNAAEKKQRFMFTMRVEKLLDKVNVLLMAEDKSIAILF